jgi:uncharacterized protein (DUF1800 family)
MRITVIRFCIPAIVLISAVLLSAFVRSSETGKASYNFPYRKAGLTAQQAAAHLVSRFTYGSTPGQVEDVAAIGVEKWFQQQLDAGLPDDKLTKRLGEYDALKLSNTEAVNTFVKSGRVRRMAVEEGFIPKDSVTKATRKEYKEEIQQYMQQKGFRPERELVRQFVDQKILRAVYSNNQLQEVMTEFWFNHFNVSFAKEDCQEFIPAYERDVIRPNALGNFEDLLIATAKSPAMLMYLDNFSSIGANDDPVAKKKGKKMNGLNENYAREVMELHTLGVDGGYTQSDVTQAARILTGWTVYPMAEGPRGKGIKKMIENTDEDKLLERGFVRDGDFLFTPNRHDKGEKTVLGKRFPANGGYEEGVQLLELLAHHPSTAKFISWKIAVRFVNDNPPATLVDKMAKTFMKKNGDIRQVLITMVSLPEFWSGTALREKTKSPFELAMSAIRSLKAEVEQPEKLTVWLNRMGQKIYYYPAPTGFPDRGQHWINSGSLLNRVNFGLALANGNIPGVTFDLLALNNNREPESAEAALIAYSKIILPERKTDEQIKRLTPLLNDPDLQKKVGKAASSTPVASDRNMEMNNAATTMDGDAMTMTMNEAQEESPPVATKKAAMKNDEQGRYRLSQVVGILIGSPEFQRR